MVAGELLEPRYFVFPKIYGCKEGVCLVLLPFLDPSSVLLQKRPNMFQQTNLFFIFDYSS